VNFFRIPADNRDLNYGKYFTEGDEHISVIEDYNSHNTEQQDSEGIKKLLLKLDEIKRLKKVDNDKSRHHGTRRLYRTTLIKNSKSIS
jgi:tmRNA-binding protein